MSNTSKIFDDGYDKWEFSPEGIHNSFAGNYEKMYFPTIKSNFISKYDISISISQSISIF